MIKSEISESWASSSAAGANKVVKSKADYSRNVKKLKIKLSQVQQEISSIEKKVKAYSDTSNDKMVAMKLAKFCKERRMTPEMLFRFADKYQKREVDKAALSQTFETLHIKLTKHEISRLEFLLDEDLSGLISWSEYNAYLHAFGIKAEYSADDQFMKETLGKFDLDKILAMADDNKIKDPSQQKRQLLSYEEFLKYCHRHMPELKDKEIASIFNRLQRNGQIDLQEFIQYMKRKQEEKKRLEEKNRRKKNGKGEEKEKEEEKDDTKTLRGIIKALLRNRAKGSHSAFHSSEFQRLEKQLGKEKGELMQLFRLIDGGRKGSFGYNQLINYYIRKESKGPLAYSYELMGKKITALGHKPEDIINQYNGCRNNMTRGEFVKFMKQEFDTIEADSTSLFGVVAKQGQATTVREILDAMKLEESQKKIVYIKPTTWKTHGADFGRKGQLTLILNPFVVLRFCISIMEELKKMNKTHWDDFEFGPTLEDPFGSFSLGREMPSDNVKWNSVTSLGMSQFYYASEGKRYESTVLCPHQTFCKSLDLLVSDSDNYLWHGKKMDYNAKEVKPEDLEHLFHGVYPLVFHSFSQYGIFVFKFFVRNRWTYVMVDSKVPCDLEDEPLFSTSCGRRHSWVSLIEKAYAKAKGSYQSMFEVNSAGQYLFEMTNKLPIEIGLPQEYSSEEVKNELWKYLQQAQEGSDSKLYALVSEAAAHRLLQGNEQTGLHKNMMYPLERALEIPDRGSTNSHKSHRLVVFRGLPVEKEQRWNPNWHRGGKNKLSALGQQVEEQLKKEGGKGVKWLKDKEVSVLNFKLFRSIFDRIFSIREVDYDKMVILRKIVEFEQKHTCRYELSSRQENNARFSMVLTLAIRKSPPTAVIQLALTDSKGQVVFQEKLKGAFSCCQLTFDSQEYSLELKVKDWQAGQDHAYCLTFYMENPRYHLKELDRQLLFDFIGRFEETHRMSIKHSEEKERKFIYRNFYQAAERSAGCCG